ncbi:MAG: FixH family protein [Endomicrobium sp.]|jgi:archaellum component FlaF (FlaF/FlaG flagellin family)|nr:FixH family protein [Endomicrobium sp.]
MPKVLFFAATIFVSSFFSVSIAVQIENIMLIKEKAKQKVMINENYYFTYVFSKKPKLGTSTIKISIFNKNGSQNTSLEILGDYDMPQMRGRHSSGPIKFKKNKNGDYLMPLNSVMRGKWEILLVFIEDDKDIFAGAIHINI